MTRRAVGRAIDRASIAIIGTGARLGIGAALSAGAAAATAAGLMVAGPIVGIGLMLAAAARKIGVADDRR